MKLGYHIEDINAFGPIIAGISLMNPIIFTLRRNNVKKDFILEPGSLYVISD